MRPNVACSEFKRGEARGLARPAARRRGAGGPLARRAGRATLLLMSLALAAHLPGCAIPPSRPVGQAVPRDYPFAPTALQIHPLTRVERRDGAVSIMAYVELLDAWGDTTKSVGHLQVQLYRPQPGRAGGLGTQELVWDIDLSDLSRNASLYDPATRMYRLPLLDAPAWVADAAASDDPDVPRARLRAVLQIPGRDGRGRMLEDEFVLE